MPNWFIAVVPADLECFAAVPDPPDGMQRLVDEDLHATVAFLGDCGEQRARLGWAAARSLWREGQIDATLGEVVPLGPKGRYSALSAKLDAGNDVAVRLLALLRDPACDAAGARRETRDPLPHVTLVRAGRKASSELRAAGLEWAAGVSLSGTPICFDALALFRGAAERGARLFDVVERVAL